VSSPLGANLVVGALERPGTGGVDCNPAAVNGVVIVLAGGMSGLPSSTEEFSRLHEPTLRRTIEGVHLAAGASDSRLIMSGGAGGEVREADLMAGFARALGFPGPRIQLERTSETTHESAQAVAAMLRNEPAKRTITLVTSAMHMRRAQATFQHAGVKVCPYPVDFQKVEPRVYEMLIPQISSLNKSVRAYHEALGLFIYWMTGKV